MASSLLVPDCHPSENAENNLQTFFILHKGSPPKPDRKKSIAKKTRRRIDLLTSSDLQTADEYDDHCYREDTFNHVWSKVESTIKGVLRNMNVDVFNDMLLWVHESFNIIRTRGLSGHAKRPIVTDATSKQLFTGLVFTKNMEFVDDLLTFKDLGLHLKSHGCHVANLSSLDFSAKSGIGGCLRGLLRQFLMVSLEVADISILALWYHEHGNYDKPMVVIIDDIERCYGPVLSDFILMLSEWVVKIPIILIMGVATTVNAPKSILPSNALQCLFPRKFILGSPSERMDAIVEAVLVRQCCGFRLGHKVASFLRNYFLRQDGTLTSFIRALKIAIVQHISTEPLSFILNEDDSEVCDSDIRRSICSVWHELYVKAALLSVVTHFFTCHIQSFWSEKHELLPEMMSKRAFDFPSCKRNELAEPNGEVWARGLSELKRLQKLWSSMVLCLYEAGKCQKVTLLDLYCEALDPDKNDCGASDYYLGFEKDFRISSCDSRVRGQYSNLHKGGLICLVIRKVRDSPATLVCQLLKSWEKLTEGINEIHEKVREMQCLVKFEDDKWSKRDLTDSSKRHTTRSNLNVEKEAKALNEKAAALLDCMVRDYMQPIECVPFHEIFCFKNVDKLQSALIGDPRRTIQVDLLEFHRFLKCSCCRQSDSTPLATMHDTSIMYMLAQEHGDLINVHDWYQSFRATLFHQSIKGKKRLKQSPSPKKRKTSNESQNKSEVSIQAQFCRAVTELQITGLLRMPSKRRPDYVQRVAFGL